MSHPSNLRKLATTTALFLVAGALTLVQAAEKGQLLIWINGDKGYNGLQKVAMSSPRRPA